MTAVHEHPLVKAALARFPGAEVVEVRAMQGGEVAAASSPKGTYSLSALGALALDEAARLYAIQNALLRMGARNCWDAAQIERAKQFEALAKLAERCAADPTIIAQLRKGAA